MDIIKKIKRQLPSKDTKIIIGVSGGVDSMVLLDVLYKVGYFIEVAHVNYNIRKNSNQDYKLIEDYCKPKNIKVHYKSIVKPISGNIQNEARRERFKFYKEISRATGINVIMLGHHQDDHLETYLLQKERNIVVQHYGLQYIREVLAMTVIRPMLNVSKKDILKYAKINDVKWNEDETNSKDIYKRNFIRNNILSNISWLKKKSILLEIEAQNKKSKALFKVCEKLNDELIFHNKISDEVFNLPKMQITIIIYSYLKENRYPVSRINKKIIGEIISFNKKTKKPIAYLDLANNFRLKKDHNYYYITKEKK